MRTNRTRLSGKRRRHASDKSAARKKFSLLSGGGFEALEVRSLLAADSGNFSDFTNSTNRFDVNGDGRVEPVDLLILIDNLNRVGARSLIASAQGNGGQSGQLLSSKSSSDDSGRQDYLDVNGDGQLSPQDALFVINALNDPPPTAIIKVEAFDLAGNPITNVAANEAFLLKVTTQDLLSPTDGPQFEGVFSMFTNIGFDRTLVTPASLHGGGSRPHPSEDPALQFDPAFNISPSGNLDAATGITGLGGATQSPSPNQPEQTVVWVAMQPQGQGNVTFTPQFDSQQTHDVFVFGDKDNPLQAEDILFQADTLTIGAANAAAKPTISINDVSVTEGALGGTQNMTFTVTVSNSNYDVQVHYATADGTATNNPPSGPRDYNATSGVLTFAAGGALTQTITVQVRGDNVAEAQENFFVNLFSSLNATIADGQGVGTIIDDDTAQTPPTVSIGDVSQNEGNAGTTNFSFPVTLSAASSQQVTVVYTTSNGTASAPGDFAATSGTLTLAPGVTTQNVVVQVAGDTSFEQNETFTVTLSSPVNATAGDMSATGTIINDDASPTPALSINDVSTAENVASGLQTFTVTLSQAATQQVTVVYTTGNGTATTADGDYTATSGTLTFAVGQTSQQFSVAINNDSKNEANETYTVTLSNVTGGATIADGTGIGTITNDDPLPTLSIGDASKAEGNSGSSQITLPVTLSAASGQQVVVVYTTSNGTATTADGDYTATSGTLTFAPGETSKNIQVAVNGDTRNEANETFNVTLSGTVNATLADGTGVATITNDDPVPNVTINNVTQVEGNSGTTNFVFTVSLSAASGQSVTVPFSTANGTATAGSDYTATSGTLTFAPGETSKTITVAVTGDMVDEAATETFLVNLGTAVNGNVTVATGTGTIQDDDGPPGLSIADLTQNEGNSGTTNFDFTVSLPVASSQTITVVYTTSNGTAVAGSDYTATSGTLTFAPGETSKTARVVVSGDTLNEANETFTVTLSNGVNAEIVDGVAMGTISNDDPLPTLSVGDAPSQTEGDSGTKAFTFPVTLSAPSGQQVTVVYTTANGTATSADGDYAPVTGTLTFAPGETSKNVVVNVNGDTTNEANETFNLVLSGAVNATLADATGTTTITNDDPVPNLSITGVTLAEGDSGSKNFAFNLVLDAPSGQQVTVVYATANGTASAGSDYTATSGTLTFAAGETSKTINVSVQGDTLSEFDETFLVNLSSPTNAALTNTSATGTIQNDDQPPGLSINSVAVEEGNSGTKTMTFTVSLAEASGIPVTVQYATGGGSATAGTDYQSTSGTLTFAAGETSKTISVVIQGDLLNESNETFNVTLSNASGDTPISIPVGVGTITNDDILSLSINDVSQAEGNAGTSSFTFNVTLSGQSDQTILVPYSTSNGTATAGADYLSTGGTLTFAPGETSKQVTVTVNGDTTFEANETFTVGVSTTAAGVTVAKGTGTGTISNDDAAPVVSINDVSKQEGTVTGGQTDFVFQVTVTGNTELPVVVSFATQDGTAIVAQDTTTVGRDYTATSGALTFAPGETTKTITVKVRADRGFETDEFFNVNLSNTQGATIGDGTGVGNILNDDPEGSFDVSSVAGYVYIDTNNNGVKDAAERPLAGVTIMLTPDTSSTFPGAAVYTAVTGADGTYKFEDVETGDYILKQVQPGFYLDGVDQVGTQGATSVANDTFHVTIDGGLDYTGNIFAERGLRSEFISKRLLISSTYGTYGHGYASSNGQSEVEDVDLTQGASWMSIDGGVDGMLTIMADGTGPGNATLTLYSSNLTQLATVNGAGGDARLDWNAAPGETFFLKVSGTNKNVDLKLTNLLKVASGVATVKGTSGDDTLSFDASGGNYKLTINGVQYLLNPAEVNSIRFDGGAGDDHLNLIDSAFDDVLNGQDDWLSLTNSHGLDLLAEGIESARAQSSTGGNDQSNVIAGLLDLELVGNWT